MPFPLLQLTRFELFRGLPEEVLRTLADHWVERTYARRELVFSKGEEGQSLYLLLDGRLQAVDFTVDGREAGLYFVDPGDYFGELAVVDGQLQSEYMIALSRSRVAMLPRQEARALILSSPELSGRVMTRFAQRLRAATAQRTLLALPNPAQRVCAQLVQLASKEAAQAPVIACAPTHQELAIMINSSRETVTRVFQVLQARAVLRREDDRLVVENLAYLTAVAEGREELPKSGG